MFGNEDEVRTSATWSVYTWVGLNKQIIFDALEKWDPINIDYKYLDREKGFIEL